MPALDLTRIALPTGVELDVAIAGDPNHPAIVLLHGFPESHRTWRHQIPELAQDHYVIAPDQRGFARSSKPEGVENYAPAKPVADLIALADHLGIGTFTLVGHDWGGAIAWEVARRHPEALRTLSILNCPPGDVLAKTLRHNRKQLAMSWYMLFFQLPWLPEWYFRRDPQKAIEGGLFSVAKNRAVFTP
ncbi:MAG: alpha/beta fold hydrolase, partial [Sphingomonas sp.]